jgi:hypothetical protein
VCDYSLHNVKSRPARVGDKLTTRDFGTGTRGFSASEDTSVAICVRPGTELSFAEKFSATGLSGWWHKVIDHKTAIFRQINKEKIAAHHDALEFPDGRIVLLTFLLEGQQATVLQLPAESKTPPALTRNRARPGGKGIGRGFHSARDIFGAAQNVLRFRDVVTIRQRHSRLGQIALRNSDDYRTNEANFWDGRSTAHHR